MVVELSLQSSDDLLELKIEDILALFDFFRFKLDPFYPQNNPFS